MALFEYTHIKKGKKQKSILLAESLDRAKDKLLQDDIVVLKLKKIFHKAQPLNKKEALNFFEGLHSLISASLPLYESLIILSEKNENKNVKLLILDLSEKIKSGLSLSDAMKEHKKTFDDITISLIANSQKTAKLDKAIFEIIKIKSSSINLKKKLISSFSYPLVLLSFCFLILNFLLFFTIPSLCDLFEGRSLHPFTKAVFATSKFIIDYQFYYFLFFIIFIIFVLTVFFSNFIKRKILEKLYSIYFLKQFFIKVALIRFSISFANLLQGGESYINALSLSIKTINHPILKKELWPIKEKVIEGNLLSDELKKSQYIPDLVSKMIAIGEETSQMPKMLFNISKIYEDEVDRFLSKLTSIIQPVLLVLLGLIIGFVVLSILIPLTDVSSFSGD
jgi:general secretion pathway protein F